MMVGSRITVVIVGLLVGLGGLVLQVLPKIPVPAVPVVVPADGVLAGLSAADRKVFKDFYAAMADVIVRDGVSVSPVCKSVFDLRNRHRNALWLAFGATDMVGKYRGLGDSLDKYLLSAVGDTDVALTPELRKAVAQALLAIQ